MRKLIIAIGLSCAGLVGAAVIALTVIVAFGPDIAVYHGRQIPKRYMTTLRSLKLINADERIKYFYSDALLDIKTGLYFVTDKNLVLYSSEWEEPETIIPFDDIASLDVQYDDSFWEDSVVYVTTYGGMEVSFPVSSEKGLDKRFVEAIRKNLNVKPVAPANANKPRR